MFPPGPSKLVWILFALSGLGYPASRSCADGGAPVDASFFRQHIEPVLIDHCYGCHSSLAQPVEGGLRLDTPAGLRAGGNEGVAVVPGDAAASLLIRALEYQDLKMPPDQPLPQDAVDRFREWVRRGAYDPRPESPSELRGEPDYREARRHWAFQPVVRPALPSVQCAAWVTQPIDAFVLQALERQGLVTAPPATRRELIRRVTYDLTGLPPSPQEVDAFVTDPSPTAYEQLVDRLLGSPRYGERWGQHWLDVVRYAETEGFEYDRSLPDAWRFRDYVIDSFNSDKPYDRFVLEQLAGDELDPHDVTLRTAAGFHRLGSVRRNAGNQLVASSRNEVLTERTDIVGVVFLGLTIGCARCHDHKFDPIPQRDYYRLQAFLSATQEDDVVLADVEATRAWTEATERVQREITQWKEKQQQATGGEVDRIQRKLLELEAALPPHLPTVCSIRNEFTNDQPVHLLRRGNPALPGERVGMRTLGVISDDAQGELPDDTVRPRTQLANWLTHPANPLTARVIANRLWQHHFRKGLVSTPNDFGTNGTRPSHPELLDYLATELLRDHWHLKHLQRSLVLSSTYRQSSYVSSTMHTRARVIDPENRLLWRFPRRRLSGEEVRDSMLTVSGQLNLTMHGPSVVLPVDEALIGQLYKPAQWSITHDAAEQVRRSIYLLAKRNLRLPFMEVFDQPAGQSSCAMREQSTHAPQALELLNGRIANTLAEAFADRLHEMASDDISDQIGVAYRLALQRRPTDHERHLAATFLQQGSLTEFALAIYNLNAFLYVD